MLGRCPGKRPHDPGRPTTGRLPSRPGSPRREECLAELARSVRPSPHIVWVPAGELADILVHVLEALFGLFQLLLQSSHRDRHLLSAAGFATALQAAHCRAAPAAGRGMTDSSPQPMSAGGSFRASTTQGPEGEDSCRSVTPDQ